VAVAVADSEAAVAEAKEEEEEEVVAAAAAAAVVVMGWVNRRHRGLGVDRRSVRASASACA
jgi:hypothetical protein